MGWNRRRHLLIGAVVVIALGPLLVATWAIFDWPPPRLILKYGFPPTGGPTGRRMTVEGIKFIELRPGYFRMGSHYLCDRGDLLGRIASAVGLDWGKRPDHNVGECPPHWVEVSEPFWFAKTELSESQFQSVSGRRDEDLRSSAGLRPIVMVSWEEAQEFCQQATVLSGENFRLPTEAEWEYACRAGSSWEFCYGPHEVPFGRYARYCSNTASGPPPTGSVHPNPWGFVDLHGSVWEWCEDSWRYNIPLGDTEWRIQGPDAPCTSPGERVAKGGSWRCSAMMCRAAVRIAAQGVDRFDDIGFRPVLFRKDGGD